MGLNLNHMSASSHFRAGTGYAVSGSMHAIAVSGAMYFQPEGKATGDAPHAVVGFPGHTDAAYIFSGSATTNGSGQDKVVFLGDVEISGTLNGGKPLNASNGADNRIGVFLDDDTIEGSDNFTYSDGVSFFVTASSAVGLGGAGKVQLESRLDLAGGSAGTAEDIRLLHVSGAVSSSLALGTSGINLKVADEKSIKIGNIAQDAYFEVAASADASSEDLRIVNTSGTDDAAIAITATAGGVDVDAAAGKDVNVAGGQVALVSKDNAASAISLTTNVGTSETIVVTNTQGTGTGAIAFTASAGGIDIGAEKAVTIDAKEASHFKMVASDISPVNLVVSSSNTNASGAGNLVLGADHSVDVNAVGSNITLDAGGGISLDSATASNFSAAAGDLTLAATAGSLVLSAGESAADSIKVESTAGGIDILASGAAAGEDIDITATGSSVNITSTEADGSAVKLHASATAGGVAIEAGTAGIALDTTGPLSIDSAGGASNISHTATAGNPFTIAMDAAVASQLKLVSAGTGAPALSIEASAGGIDIVASGSAGEDIDIISTASSVNISSAENVADAIVLNASAGGIDITAAGGASEDIDISNTAGSVNISAGEADAAAIVLNASAGGVDITTAANFDVDVVAGNNLNIDAQGTTAGDGVAITLGTDTAATKFSVSANTAGEKFSVASDGFTKVTGDMQITGDLNVAGTTVTIDTTNLHVKDPLLLLGSGSTVAGNKGIVLRQTATQGQIMAFVNSDSAFVFGQVDNDPAVLAGESNDITVDTNLAVRALEYQINGSSNKLALSGDDVLIDAAGDIILDADDADVVLKDGGTTIGGFGFTDQNLIVSSSVADKDIIFSVVSGSSRTEVARFDASGDQGQPSFLMATNRRLQFSNASEAIFSDGTDLNIEVGAGGDINLPSSIGLTFGDDGEIIEGDGSGLTVKGGTLTLDSEGDIILDADDADVVLKDGGTTIGGFSFAGQNLHVSSSVANKDIVFTVASGSSGTLTEVARFDASGDGGQPSFLMATNRRLQFSTADEAIYSDGTDLHIEVGSNGDINIPANIGLVFDGGLDSEKIESDGTDLTIRAGADINLTATSDVNIPASVGLTFGDNGEKIEGDGTDLTVVSSGKLHLNTSGTANIRLSPGGGKVLPHTANNISLGGNNTETIVASLDVKSATSAFDSTTTVVRLNSLGDAGSAQSGDTLTVGGFSATVSGAGSETLSVASSVSVKDASFPLDSTSTLVRFNSLPTGAIAGDKLSVSTFSATLSDAPSATKSVKSSFGSDIQSAMSGKTVDDKTKIIRASTGDFSSVFSGDSITIGSGTNAVTGTTGDADGGASTSLASFSSTAVFASSFVSSITGTNEGSLSGVTLGSTTTSITFTSESILQGVLGTDIRQDDVVVIGDANFKITSDYSSGNAIAVTHTSGTQAGISLSGGSVSTITTAGNSNSPGGLVVTISGGTQSSISGSTLTSITTIGASISPIGSNSVSSNPGSASITTVGIEVNSGTGTSSSDPSTDSTKTITRAERRYFSDLFLGDGAVINFNNSDYTITHSSGVATFSGQITTAGNILPSSDNALDLGSESARFRNIFTGDLSLRNDRGDWTLIEEEDFISFRNNKTGRRFRMIMEDITGLGNYGPGNDGEM